MTKRDLLLKMSAAPLDCIILDENGKPIKAIFFDPPDDSGYTRRAMITSNESPSQHLKIL